VPQINITETTPEATTAEFDETQGVVVILPYESTNVDDTNHIEITTIKATKYDANAIKTPDGCAELESFSAFSIATKKYMIEQLANTYGYNVYVVSLIVKTDTEVTDITSTLFKALEDKNLYSINYILCDNYFTQLLSIAQNRSDCLAFLDDNKDTEGNSLVYDKTGALLNAEEIKNYIRDNFKGSVTDANGRYGAYVGGCFEVSDGTNKYTVPGSYMWLVTRSSTQSQNPVWSTVAGVTRGQVQSGTPLVSISSFEMEEWVGDNNTDFKEATLCLNPIVNITGYGNCIMGNNTLAPVSPSGKTCINYLNVRLMLNYLKKQLRYICVGLMFDSNDIVLFNSFRAQVTAILEQMKQTRGIQYYKISKTDSTQTNVIKPVITIAPYGSVEKFDITVNPVDADVTESENE
jgi:hypothetical protein